MFSASLNEIFPYFLIADQGSWWMNALIGLLDPNAVPIGFLIRDVSVFLHAFHFSFQPVFHDWCTKDRGMMHIKEPLLLIGKSSPCGGSRYSLSLAEWSFTICLTPYSSK